MLWVIALLLMLLLLVSRCCYHMSYLDILAWCHRCWVLLRGSCIRWLLRLLDVDVTTTSRWMVSAWGRSTCIVVSIRRRHLIQMLRMLRLPLDSPMMVYFYSRWMNRWRQYTVNLDGTLLCISIIISLVRRGLWRAARDLDLMLRRDLNDPDLLLFLVWWLLNTRGRWNVLVKISVLLIYLFDICSLRGQPWWILGTVLNRIEINGIPSACYFYLIILLRRS